MKSQKSKMKRKFIMEVLMPLVFAFGFGLIFFNALYLCFGITESGENFCSNRYRYESLVPAKKLGCWLGERTN